MILVHIADDRAPVFPEGYDAEFAGFIDSENAEMYLLAATE